MIHILPPDIVSKIAAGEVIERPASVIKELVENALDANSRSIDVELRDAGKTLIKIRDTGHGIPPSDLEKIFFRHATSKIQSAQDLEAIASLGFRGEALYSIGAIADVTLRSRPSPQEDENFAIQKQDSGWEIHLRGGERLSLRPCAMAGHGTEIEVSELFFNTPARRKFLKTNTSEINQILNIFIPYTLLRPDIRFRLSHQGRDLFDLRPADAFKDRIHDALRLDQRHLLEIRQTIPRQGLTVHMILGSINIQRARRDMQFIFVNRRPVFSKAMSYHLNQIYRLILPPEVFPFFAVYIEIPPKEIDVNIHPTKREIKIRDESAVCAALRGLCEQTLMTAGQARQAASSSIAPAAGLSAAFKYETEPPETGESSAHETLREHPSPTYAYPQAAGSAFPGVQDFFIPQGSLLNEKKGPLHNRLGQARYIGAFISKFLLFEFEQTLFVLDQHAAAERITYEKIITQMQKGQVEAQRLLSPLLLKMTLQEMNSWMEMQEVLSKAGLESTQWDSQTIAVHTQPLLLKDAEKAVRAILAGASPSRSDFDALARRACRSSIMTGDRLSPQEAVHQRDELIQCLDPFTCPHGRPTVIEVTEHFLDKQFLRT